MTRAMNLYAYVGGIPGPRILRIQAIGAPGTYKIQMANNPSGHRMRESFGLARRNPNRASASRTQAVTPRHGRRPAPQDSLADVPVPPDTVPFVPLIDAIPLPVMPGAPLWDPILVPIF